MTFSKVEFAGLSGAAVSTKETGRGVRDACAFNSKPQTLYPKAQILNPKPHTLNPKA